LDERAGGAVGGGHRVTLVELAGDASSDLTTFLRHVPAK
jgi:hypothetical protein